MPVPSGMGAIYRSIAAELVDSVRLSQPVDRGFLNQRMPSGAVIKTAIVYDEPFWRANGLSGQSTRPDSPATLTIDDCTDAASPGLMCLITEGPAARRPVEYHEQNCSTERCSGGGMISHAPTGVLSESGYTLREPCCRNHRAGTESSAVMCGWIDGAIRSGERPAAEMPAADLAAVGRTRLPRLFGRRAVEDQQLAERARQAEHHRDQQA